MNQVTLNALQGNFNLILADINWLRRLEDAEDGTDVYGMTVWRCFPQFFFYCHLPNQWDNNEGGGWATIDGVNLGGPLLALALMGFMLGAGAYFMKHQEKRLIKSKLSEEVLLAYFAIKSKAQEDSAIASQYAETFRNMDALIQKQKNADMDEKKRIGLIEAFAGTHAAAISGILDQECACETGSMHGHEKSWLRRTWERTYDVFCHYSYLHWILWMLSTVVLYQTVKNYGINQNDPEHSDCPAWFTDNVIDFSRYDAALLFQTVLPFLLSLLIVYKGYKTEQRKPVFDRALANEKQSLLRAFYLDKSSSAFGDTVEQTHTHFSAAVTLTSITTFISTFIISNVAIWPIQGFVMKVCDLETSDTTYIPVIFAVTAAISLLQASLKAKDMMAVNAAYLGDKGCVTVMVPKPAAGVTGAASRVWRFYSSKEHQHKAWYYIPGQFMGSGGLLLTRILLNGGMGNVRQGHINQTNRSDMLEIGLYIAAAMIILKLTQYYIASQREAVFKAVDDAALLRQRQAIRT